MAQTRENPKSDEGLDQDQAPPKVDPVTLEVFRHLFSALTEEMGGALRRAAYSPNIKERRDYSCALFSMSGTPVAMGDHMPVHLGAMPMSVSAALDELGALRDGDVACLNDPFCGGTHLPDITLVTSVFFAGRLLGYVASRAHHSDVGGMSPGSMPLATEIFQEGLRIPPVLLYREGQRNEDIQRLILANVRTPEERAGDLDAQLAALNTGKTRLIELAERAGPDTVYAAMDGLVGYADRLIEAGIAKIPNGSYRAEDWIEDDGFDSGPLPIRVALHVRDNSVEVDFTGTCPQTRGGVNAVAAITSSATRYVIRCVVQALLGEIVPAGGGSLKSVTLTLPANSLVNASLPASVAAGNVETSQRITDVLLKAFTEALPSLMPALSQGTMNNTAIGGVNLDGKTLFAYYETIGGGMGGGPGMPKGLSGVHTHMSNSLNTPIEALEHAYPFRITRYEIRRGSGGEGASAGGDGLRRDLELLVDSEVTLLTERRERGPSGANGGDDGMPGENWLLTKSGDRRLPGKVSLRAKRGNVLSIRTPGGGGWGSVS